ncbi:MAG TPA: CBS domain-containing protein [Pirellulaceae bacterium]|nr:CBS domain-containing protein [Pirellulaceae bacterium]
MYQVKDIMTNRAVAVGPETTIDEAIDLLLDHRVSGLPVVDKEGLLLGVISEIDVIDLVYKAEIQGSIVRDYMTRDAHSLDVDSSLDDAAAIFCRKTIRRIPIVRDGRLVGIISRRDLIRFVREVRRQAAAL